MFIINTFSLLIHFQFFILNKGQEHYVDIIHRIVEVHSVGHWSGVTH